MSNENAEQDTRVEYQVLHVVATTLCTRQSFWAHNDAEARKLAGTIPSGAVLCRVVERL